RLDQPAVEAAGRLPTPVAATDGSGAASELTRGVTRGTMGNQLEVRGPVFRAGQPSQGGHPVADKTTTVQTVPGTTLTVPPAVQAPADYLEALARAEFALFRDEACAPPDRPD